MKNYIDLIDQFSGHRLVVHAVDCVMKARMIFQVADVLKAAGGKIVDDKDFVAALQVRVGKVRADKACASSDHDVRAVGGAQFSTPKPLAMASASFWR